MVCPTMSGMMVELRDQVLIIRFSPFSFMAFILARSFWST